MAGKGKKFPIEGVSWLEQLFDMVAVRNAEQKPLMLYIPDTVVFRYQRPAALYTNDSAEEHQVSCRDDLSDLSADALYQRFGARKEASEKVCAQYIYIDRHGHDLEERDDEADDAQNVVVEYMNPPQLRHFLQQRTKENNGILQRFLPNKGSYHTTIRVMWTPRTCHVETRTNRNKMEDIRLSVTDRFSTFDGGPHLSLSHNLKGGLFYRNIKEAADNIVRHVETLIPRPYQVWETVLYFKYCTSERGTSEKSGISFLWCSSMRVFKDELLDLRRLDEFWTSDIKTEVMLNKEAPDKELKVMKCPITGKPYKDGTGTEVMIGTIVKYLTILGKSLPNAPETLKFIQEAADLDEQATSKDSGGGRGSAKNNGNDAIREIISDLMSKKSAAREVCDLIKRVLFGNPEAADAAKIRAIFNHETFIHKYILVSEDTALDASLVVERDSVRTKAKSTPSNDAAQFLARSARAHMKKAGAGLMPASVVEVKAIVVTPENVGGANGKKIRASSSKSPVGRGDELGGMLHHGTMTKGGTLSTVGMLSQIDSTKQMHSLYSGVSTSSWGHRKYSKHVDIQLGSSKILSFRRLKYLPMGAPTVRGPITIVEQSNTDNGGQSPEPNKHEESQQRSRLSQIKHAGGGGLYSKLSAGRHEEDQESADGTLDSSVVSQDGKGLNDARHKVLGQYAAYDKNASNTGADAHREDEGRRHHPALENDAGYDTVFSRDAQRRPPPLHLDHESTNVPLATSVARPTQTRISQHNIQSKGVTPEIVRPHSDHRPREMQRPPASNRAPLRPVSAQHYGSADNAEHTSSIKHYKVLDSEWSSAMRDTRDPHVVPLAKHRLTGLPLGLQKNSRLPSAKSRLLSAGAKRISSAASTASTRVSSAVSATRSRRTGSAMQGRHEEWSDGDLIDDDDDEDWDDGLEMDLPSTHSRMKRDSDLRSSRETDRMLRKGSEKRGGGGGSKNGGTSMPLCLQWGLDDRVRAKVLQQYSAYG
jgi:hypothetical protein